jgi:hypothetical protein
MADWKRVDERLVELGVERAAHEHDVCRWLLCKLSKLRGR